MARRLLLILGMLPFLAWGAEAGPTRAKTVVEPHRLVLRIHNGEQGTLLVKTVRLAMAEPGSPDKPACTETVTVARTVRRWESRDMELLPLDVLANCANQAGYWLPAGSRAVEAAESPICSSCVPAEAGGGIVTVVPFSVRVEMSYPGILQEYRSFTNYLFFQQPPKVRPILLQ